MKKPLAILSIISILIVCLCACGTPKASPIEDFEYEFEDGVTIITKYIGSDLDIVIPSEIENRPVTIIADEAFENYDLKSVVVPEGVIEIEEGAFNDCECLESITLPDTLTECSYKEFSDTLWYESQPENTILYINNIVIGYKGNLPNDIKIKDGTKTILDKALLSEYSITGKIHIPNSVEHLGYASIGFFDKPTENPKFSVITPMDSYEVYCKEGSVAYEYAIENELAYVLE